MESTEKMNFIETFIAGMTPAKTKPEGVRKQARQTTRQCGIARLTQQKTNTISQDTESRRFTRSVIKSQSQPQDSDTMESQSSLSNTPDSVPVPGDNIDDDQNMENQSSPIPTILDYHDQASKSNIHEDLEKEIWEKELGTYGEGYENQTPTKTVSTSDLDSSSANISTHTSPYRPDPVNPCRRDNGTYTIENKYTQCSQEDTRSSANSHTLEQLTEALQKLKTQFAEELIPLKAQNKSLLQSTADLKSQITDANMMIETLMEKSKSKSNQQFSSEDFEARIQAHEIQIKKFAQEEARHMSTEARKFLSNKLGKQIGDEIEVLREDFRNKTNIMATEIDNNQK